MEAKQPTNVKMNSKEPASEIEWSGPEQIPLQNLKILMASGDGGYEMLISLIVKVLGKEILNSGIGAGSLDACRVSADMDWEVLDKKTVGMNSETSFMVKSIRGESDIKSDMYSSPVEGEVTFKRFGFDDFESKPFCEAEIFKVMQKLQALDYLYSDRAISDPAETPPSATSLDLETIDANLLQERMKALDNSVAIEIDDIAERLKNSNSNL